MAKQELLYQDYNGKGGWTLAWPVFVRLILTSSQGTFW